MAGNPLVLPTSTPPSFIYRRTPPMPTLALTRMPTTNGNGHHPRPIPLEKLFGQNTFGLDQMKARLPGAVYRRLVATVESGAPLDETVADAVALAM